MGQALGVSVTVVNHASNSRYLADLRRLLAVEDSELERILGAPPQAVAGFARLSGPHIRLCRLHSLLRSVEIALDGDEAAVGAWIRREEAGPSVLSLLGEGRIGEASLRASGLIFRREPRPRPGRTFRPDPRITDPAPRRPPPADLGFEGLDDADEQFE